MKFKRWFWRVPFPSDNPYTPLMCQIFNGKKSCVAIGLQPQRSQLVKKGIKHFVYFISAMCYWWGRNVFLNFKVVLLSCRLQLWFKIAENQLELNGVLMRSKFKGLIGNCMLVMLVDFFDFHEILEFVPDLLVVEYEWFFSNVMKY